MLSSIIDTATDKVTGAIDLPYQNPVTDFCEKTGWRSGDRRCVRRESYGALDGGLAVISGTSVSAGGV